jgi:hypothetical protein
LTLFCNPETVDVVQSVRTSDCGSEGRGFEPHLPPKTSQAAHHQQLGKFIFGSAPNFDTICVKIGLIKLRYADDKKKPLNRKQQLKDWLVIIIDSLSFSIDPKLDEAKHNELLLQI